MVFETCALICFDGNPAVVTRNPGAALVLVELPSSPYPHAHALCSSPRQMHSHPSWQYSLSLRDRPRSNLCRTVREFISGRDARGLNRLMFWTRCVMHDCVLWRSERASMLLSKNGSHLLRKASSIMAMRTWNQPDPN